MKALVKPLVALVALAAVAYGSSHAQSPVAPSSTACCALDGRPAWMSVEAGGPSLAVASPVIERRAVAQALAPIDRAARPQATRRTAATPAADEVGGGAEPNTLALILAAIGVVALIARRRFGG